MDDRGDERAGASPTMTPAARRWASVVIAGWLIAQVLACVRPALPLPRWLAGRLPWGMFTEPPRADHRLRAGGRARDGTWLEVPLDRYFRFTRGATGERLVDNHEIFLNRGHGAERAAFAAWLIDRMAADGVALTAVRLTRMTRVVKTGRVETYELGVWEVTP